MRQALSREITDAVRKNVTIDWTMRENVRAQLRVIVKTDSPQIRLHARQSGEGNADRTGAGGVVGLRSGGLERTNRGGLPVFWLNTIQISK